MNNMKLLDCIEIVGSSCPKYNGVKNYVSTGAVSDNTIDSNQVETYLFEDKPSRANLVVTKGCVLFAKMMETKKTLIINEELQENIYSTGFYAVRPKEAILNDFF